MNINGKKHYAWYSMFTGLDPTTVPDPLVIFQDALKLVFLKVEGRETSKSRENIRGIFFFLLWPAEPESIYLTKIAPIIPYKLKHYNGLCGKPRGRICPSILNRYPHPQKNF